jgi:hypothetical protein
LAVLRLGTAKAFTPLFTHRREMQKREIKEASLAERPAASAFDSDTVSMLRDVLRDAWARLPAGQTSVSRLMLAERILKAAKTGERDPAKLRAHAISASLEAALRT